MKKTIEDGADSNVKPGGAQELTVKCSSSSKVSKGAKVDAKLTVKCIQNGVSVEGSIDTGGSSDIEFTVKGGSYLAWDESRFAQLTTKAFAPLLDDQQNVAAHFYQTPGHNKELILFFIKKVFYADQVGGLACTAVKPHCANLHSFEIAVLRADTASYPRAP